MTVKINKNFFKIMDQKIIKGLLSSAEFYKGKVKEELNRSGGISSPGEAPKKQSGDLFDSIQIDKTGLAQKKVKIGSDEDYAAALEAGTLKMAARPYLRNTFRENKKGIIDAFVKGAKK